MFLDVALENANQNLQDLTESLTLAWVGPELQFFHHQVSEIIWKFRNLTLIQNYYLLSLSAAASFMTGSDPWNY